MSRVNPTVDERRFDEGRLMQVLVAPIVSEKATFVAEKSNARSEEHTSELQSR